jgi:hypothetical protein
MQTRVCTSKQSATTVENAKKCLGTLILVSTRFVTANFTIQIRSCYFKPRCREKITQVMDTYTVALDVLVLVLSTIDVTYKFWVYSQNRNPHTRFMAWATMIVLVNQLFLLLGLGLHVIDPWPVFKLLLISYVFATPLYCVIVTQRVISFKSGLPHWAAEKLEGLSLVRVAIFFTIVDFILCWPIVIFALYPEIEHQNEFIKNYHFVGWGIWNTFMLCTDLLLCALSLRKVLKIKRRLNTGVAHSKEVERRTNQHYAVCLFLLVCVFASDTWNITESFRHIFNRRSPDLYTMNYLGCSFMLHMILAFGFLVSLGTFIKLSRNEAFGQTRKAKDDGATTDSHGRTTSQDGGNNTTEGTKVTKEVTAAFQVIEPKSQEQEVVSTV